MSKTDYLDVAITGADFKFISKNLAFPKLKTFKQTLTKNDILTQIQGEKTGYAITKIEVTDNNFADVDSSTHTLTLKKDGIFAIKITLQKASAADVTINGQIEYKPKPTLTFTKLTTAKKTLTKTEIIAKIKGTKNGYTLKNIVVDDTNFATVDNSNFSLSLKKEGIFTATITMGKANYFDVTFKASFEGKAENLTFMNLTTTYIANLSSSVILAQVQGIGKANYTLKSISTISDNLIAEVQGSGANSSITLKKAGTFTATIVLGRNGYFNVTIPAATFIITKAAAKTLTFDKLITGYSYKKTLSKIAILAQVQGEKTNYTLKSISNLNPNTIAELTGTAKNLSFSKLTIPYKKTITKAELFNQITGDKTGYSIQSINAPNPNDIAELSGLVNIKVKKVGDFTTNIILTHSFYGNTTVQANFTINKLPTPTNLRFTSLTTTFKNALTEKNILNNVTGNKTGYTLKSISNISANNIAELSGAVAIKIKKAGSFTADIILEHSFYKDKTFTAVNFTINSYSFKKLTTAYKKTITKVEIEGQIQALTGYTLKEVTGISATDIAAVTGATKTSIQLKRAGSFTANLIMKKSGESDVIINHAEFEIMKLLAKKLRFDKLNISKELITKENILAQVKGDKKGYTLKSITAISGIDMAGLTGTPKLSLYLKKIGLFTATLTLEHLIYSDVELTGAEFEIANKLPAKKLTFKKLKIPYQNTVSKSDILKQIQGKKTGYTLKAISGISAADVAEFTGSPQATLRIKKAGSFTAILTLSHPLYLNVEITGAEFELVQLIFNKLKIAYKSVIAAKEIEGKIEGLTGYTLKSITGISATDIAEVTGTPKTSILLKKAGSFTATLLVKKAGESDYALSGAKFEITKLPAKKLTFKKLMISSKTLLREKDLLARIPEVDKKGYTLKSITGIQVLSGSPKLVEVTGSPVPSIKINEISGIGIFTAEITLKHPFYLDATLTGATFEKKEPIFVFDEKTKTITGVTAKYKTYFATATEVTFPDQINGIDVEVIKSNSKGVNVFGGDTSANLNQTIKTIHLPKNLKTIGDYAFQYCLKLTSVNIPDSVTSIGKDGFRTCTALTSIALTNSLISIGTRAFYHCEDLVSVTMGDHLTSIGNYAFSNSKALTSITLPKSVTTIGQGAFASCTALTSITLPESVTTIEDYTLQNCSSLTSVTLPKTLTTIGRAAFQNCPSLTSITLPKTLTTIKFIAFQYCTSLTSITLPESVTTLGEGIFYDVPKIIVIIKQANPKKVTSLNSQAFDRGILKIKVPLGSLQTYRTANIWKQWKDKMEGYSVKKLAFKKLITYKKVLSQEDMIAQITELSGVELSSKDYTIKSISNIKALSGGAELSGAALVGVVELSGTSTIKINKKELSFTADMVLQRSVLCIWTCLLQGQALKYLN